MNQELYYAILAGAKAESKRIREAIEAGGKDKPLSVRPSDSERYYLEVDFRDGEVLLRCTYGDGRPEYVHRGDAAWFGHIDPPTSHLALAASLEERAHIVAAIAATELDDRIQAGEQLDLELQELGKFWVMDPEEFYASDMPAGTETDDELEIMASAVHSPDPDTYLAFGEAEALDWLRRHREYAIEDVNEAA
jgi:hypothetical protein